ncbi:MAG: RNA polymerase sigma factor [Microthrixaceae bacterium]|nr:RNA polymerase sigma factor [Microthrixaceae bacterium]
MGDISTRGMEPPIGSRPLVEVDEVTVRRAQHGDAAALDQLVRSLMPYLGRICGAIALDAGDDALQNTMIAITKNLPSLREPAALRGWARRIAVREAVRVARVGRSIPVDPNTLRPPPVPDGATAVEVRALLDQLGPEHRAALVLRHLDGLDEAEMAEVLGVAPGTVKSRLHRARGAFRERWIK